MHSKETNLKIINKKIKIKIYKKIIFFKVKIKKKNNNILELRHFKDLRLIWFKLKIMITKAINVKFIKKIIKI